MKDAYYRVFEPSSATELDAGLERHGVTYLKAAVRNRHLYEPYPTAIRRKFYAQVYSDSCRKLFKANIEDYELSLSSRYEEVLTDLRSTDPKKYSYEEWDTDDDDSAQPDPLVSLHHEMREHFRGISYAILDASRTAVSSKLLLVFILFAIFAQSCFFWYLQTTK